jgi:acyl-CoA thioester hydrolase
MDNDAPLTAPAGRFVGREHHFALRVYFEDTDLTGAVYHANYLRYLERARSEMLAQAGLDQRTAFDAGEGAYAIAGLSIRYRAPARLGDDLAVRSRMIRVRGAGVDIHQRVMRGDVILAEADVDAVFVAPSGRPRRPPADWAAAFETHLWQGN